MEAFQKELNLNRDEWRRTNWKKHRIRVMSLFERVFSKKDSVDKMAIFGAGNCDDLDLDYLASKCNHIYLFDIDGESMKRALKNFSENTRNNVELVELDVTGLNKIEFEQKLTFLLKGNKTTDEIVQFLKDTESDVEELNDWNEYIESFNVVATSAIYTQLFYNWALDLLSEYTDQYNQEDLSRIKEAFLDLRDQIVLTFNDSVRKSCRDDGFFILWSDILQIEPEYLETINKGPNAIFSLASNVGFGAALIAIQDFIMKVEKGDFFLTYWPWDFHKDKQYLVMGMLGKKV